MQEHNHTPKDNTNENEFTTNFEFEQFGIGFDEIQAEAENLAADENGFPIGVFPKPIQQVICATNDCLNFPVDFIGASLLYASSVAIGNTYSIKLKRGFQQNAVVYLAIVARAGTTKSHPLSWALQPIFEQDKRTYNDYQEQLKDYKRDLAEHKKSKGKTTEPIKPIWKKHLVSDFTPEALAQVHKFNQRGIGVYTDELASWFKNFNRYNKGSEMEFWLSQWSGKPINIDRKQDEPVFIPVPFISVAGTIQTALLNELAKESRTLNGFTDRILFVILNDLKKECWSEKDLPEIVSINWKNIIEQLLKLNIEFDETGSPIPEVLELTPEAQKALFEWQKKNTDETNEAPSEALSGIFSKMDMHVLRLALILEMLFYACSKKQIQGISIEATLGAIELVEYFKNSAALVEATLSNTNPLDILPADKKALYRSLPETFTTEQGLVEAHKIGIAERTFKRFLNSRDLFSRIKHGIYEKLI